MRFVNKVNLAYESDFNRASKNRFSSGATIVRLRWSR